MSTRTTLVWRTMTAGLALGVAVTLAGCGNANAPGNAGSSTHAVSYSDQALTKDQIMKVAYAAATKAGSAHMTMSVSGKQALKAVGDVAYGHGQPAMAMTMSMAKMGAGTIRMKYVDKVFYLQVPHMVPTGKYVAIDPADKNSPFAQGFAGATSEMDPMKGLKAVESAVTSAKRVGKQNLDGTTVEHYKVTVDTTALVKGIAPEAAQHVKLPKTVTYDLWLDQQHLLRRMSFDLMGESFQATMSKWGEPVHVTRPPAGQVVSMSKMMTQMQQPSA